VSAPDAPSEIVKPTGRTGRAAAQKPKAYTADLDSELDSDDQLGDVTAMVKGIGGNSTEGPTRLYHPPSVSRPSSSHGVKTKARPSKLNTDREISDDESNWAGLAQNSPQKIANRTMLSEDDDSVVEDKKPAPKLAAKVKPAASKAKEPAALKPKKAPAAAIPKPALSPAARAYAIKHGGGKNGAAQAKAGAAKPAAKSKAASKREAFDSDEDGEVDAIANEILSDDDEDEDAGVPVKAVAARPSRRAAAAKPKSKYTVDSEQEVSEEEDVSAEFDDESD